MEADYTDFIKKNTNFMKQTFRQIEISAFKPDQRNFSKICMHVYDSAVWKCNGKNAK